MKRFLIKFSLFILLIIPTVQKSSAQSKASPKSTDSSATVIFYRKGQFFSAATNYAIYVNDDKICKLSNNKYLSYRTKPGHYTFNAKHGGVEILKKETGLDLDVEAGKTYYVSCEVQHSITRDRLDMEEVTENTANRDLKGMTQDNCDEESDSDKPAK